MSVPDRIQRSGFLMCLCAWLLVPEAGRRLLRATWPFLRAIAGFLFLLVLPLLTPVAGFVLAWALRREARARAKAGEEIAARHRQRDTAATRAPGARQ